jgi:histidinol-phosphate aminotransferase
VTDRGGQEILERLIKKEIRDLVRVKDTFDERFEYLRLDKNERLLPFDGEVLGELRKKITSAGLSGYGELGPLYRRLAEYLSVGTDQLLIAHGSDIAIKSLYEACVGRGDNIVLHLPCYAMYRVYGRMFGAEVRGVPVRDDWNADLEGMLKQVDGRTKFVVMENPNGFVGTRPSLDVIERAASFLHRKGALLLIDEAYLYVENDRSETIPLINAHPNLVVSQSFSKAHGLAGMRVGYLVGDGGLMGQVAKVRPMHEVTNLSALAATWVLDHPELLKEYQDATRQSKEFLKTELPGIGITFRDGHGNFILLHLPPEGRTVDMAERLKERGILIRRPFEEPYLRGWSRVCVGSPVDSKRFVDALKSILS